MEILKKGKNNYKERPKLKLNQIKKRHKDII
jgi:hypothetical protein